MSIMNKNIERIKLRILPILKRNNIVRAGVFGSYARGDYKKNSDIDLLVEINDKKMSLLGFIHIKNILEESLGRKVDLVEYKLIRPEIKDNILNEEVRIL